MNESFMRKVYENPTENVMQQGLNFYSDQEPGTFMIQACRCRRCGGLLTSKEGVRNGIGHVCRMKALREMPDPNQVTVFDVLGDKEENTHEK